MCVRSHGFECCVRSLHCSIELDQVQFLCDRARSSSIDASTESHTNSAQQRHAASAQPNHPPATPLSSPLHTSVTMPGKKDKKDKKQTKHAAASKHKPSPKRSQHSLHTHTRAPLLYVPTDQLLLLFVWLQTTPLTLAMRRTVRVSKRSARSPLVRRDPVALSAPQLRPLPKPST